jgi:predicted MFS family arabinose efflux permease
MLTGGGLLVWLTARIHWRGAFLAMSALMMAVMLVTLAVPEPAEGERAAGSRVGFGDIGRALLGSLRARAGVVVLAMVATYKLGESMADTMFKPFLVDRGFTAAQIGLWSGTWGMAASLLGSLAGGLLATRLPIVRALAIAAGLRTLPLAAEWWLTLGQPLADQVIAVTLAENFFGGALTTAMFAFIMSRVDARIGATHFTALAALEVLGKAPAGIASGWIAGRWGYPSVFAAAVALSAAWLLFFPLLMRSLRR